MGNFVKIIFVAAISALLISCNESTTEATLTTYNITGNVQDSNGNPLDDVDVYFVYHFDDLPSEGSSNIENADSLYQNYPNPFSDTTIIKFKTYRSIRYEVKLLDYYYSSSSILRQGSCAPGIVETPVSRFDDFPNGFCRISVRYIVNFTTRFNSEIELFINRSQPEQLIHSKPNLKAANGQFNVNLRQLPLQKTVNFTDAQGSDAVPKQISNLIKFVLIKDGYKPLQIDYNIDRYSHNEVTFKMVKN